MTAEPRQRKHVFVGPTGSTTIAATFDSPVLAGSTIVCFPTNDTGVAGTASVADDVNGAYPAALQTVNDAVTGTRLQLFVFENTVVGTPTVTVTWTGSVFSRGIYICEYPGVPAASVDQSAGQTQATPGLAEGAVTSTATATLATSSSIAIAVCINGAGTHTPALVLNQGWVNADDFWSGFGSPNLARAASKVVTGTAGVAGVFTAGGNDAHSTIVLVLKATPDSTNSYVPPQSRPVEPDCDGDFPAELVLKRWF